MRTDFRNSLLLSIAIPLIVVCTAARSQEALVESDCFSATEFASNLYPDIADGTIYALSCRLNERVSAISVYLQIEEGFFSFFSVPYPAEWEPGEARLLDSMRRASQGGAFGLLYCGKLAQSDFLPIPNCLELILPQGSEFSGETHVNLTIIEEILNVPLSDWDADTEIDGQEFVDPLVSIVASGLSLGEGFLGVSPSLEQSGEYLATLGLQDTSGNMWTYRLTFHSDSK